MNKYSNEEFPFFSDWKKDVLHTTDKEKFTKLTDQELLNAYIHEKEQFEIMKKQAEIK